MTQPTIIDPVLLKAFWAAVASIGWGTKTTDYRAVHKHLIHTWTVETACDMRDVFRTLQDLLDERIGEYVSGVGYDGYNDLKSHIIGLGREAFERTLADPARAQRLVNTQKVRESFSYCLPHKGEYRQKDPEHHARRFARFASQLTARLDYAAFVPVRRELSELITLLIAAVRDPKSLLGENGARALTLYKQVTDVEEGLDLPDPLYAASLEGAVESVKTYLDPES